jgi:hypothetical protein
MTTDAYTQADDALAQVAYRAGRYHAQAVALEEKNAALEGEIATLTKKLKPSGLRRVWLTCRDTVVFASLVWIGWVGHVVLAPAQPVVTYTGSAPRPTQERRPPRQEQPQDSAPAPASAPVFADATPEPTYDNEAYNATAAAVQEEEAAPAAEILIVVTPTVLPEPGQPGFESSFQEPVCSAMITYLRGHPCYGRVGQKPLPQPGDSDFAASFEEPGE